MKTLIIALFCLLVALPVAAQDDCPAGHVRNPPVSPLDNTYMLAAFKASFQGIFGRQPTCQPGSGKDDCNYYIGASNHYGVYGDDQCHAGWSGYWESWLAVGHGDLSLVQTPAKFLPGSEPAPQPQPQPTPQPSPVPEGVLIAKVDNVSAKVDNLTIRLEQLRLEIANLTASMDEAHKAINQNVSDGRAENRSFFSAVAEHWKAVTAIAAPFVTYLTCRYSGGC